METSTKVSGRNKVLAFINIAAFATVIIFNILASALPINGNTTGQVSNKYPSLFTPAGITFSIWSVIYIFIFGFIIFQAKALLSKSHNAAEKVAGVSKWFLINCIANVIWLFAWHYHLLALSVAIIIVMLLSLIMIYKRLQLPLPKEPLAEKLWLDIPFGIYLGWISVATIANIAAYLTAMEWNGFGVSASSWAIILIAVATALGAYMVVFKNNFYYTLVILWALYGIVLKLKADPNETHTTIVSAGNICFAVTMVLLLVRLYYNKFGKTNPLKVITSNQTPASV